jgi:phosphoribosylformylglycinamidine synthase
VWEQYDHLVMGHTVQRPGGDAAVVRLPESRKALAMTSDCTPRYCQADPRRGGAQAVAESWRNLTAVGARPLAVTDNMNFGNPQRPEIMGQFAGCIEGMAEACRALDYPVVSGNVSLYNETNGKGILPTPVIGGVGLLDDYAQAMSLALKAEGEILILIGETKGHLGSSLYLRDIIGREDGPPPPVDLAAERRNGDFVRTEILAGRVSACHDLSDGGLLVALAEMAMAGGIGATLEGSHAAETVWLFGEDQARYLLAVPSSGMAAMLNAAKAAGVPAEAIGQTGGASLTVSDRGTISLERLKKAHESWLPGYMNGKAA